MKWQYGDPGWYETRDEHKRHVFMEVAGNLAALGTCDRKQVGTVIVLDGRCVSWGFNGAPPGLPHCDANNHGWFKPAHEHFVATRSTMPHSKREERDPWIAKQIEEHGCRNATHAEANALAAAARQGISTSGGSLFTTCSPCDTCSRLIIAAGIVHVYFLEEYRDRAGIELLLAARITCEQL